MNGDLHNLIILTRSISFISFINLIKKTQLGKQLGIIAKIWKTNASNIRALLIT